jgi:hypothetical protein
LHCMIPGGALSELGEKKIWRKCISGFLFPVKVMSKLMKKYFLKLLKETYKKHSLIFKGGIANLSDPGAFEALIDFLSQKSWNVYAKLPFHGAKGGIEYLARYVSKTAISNERILSCTNTHVTFKWRDYSDGNKLKVMQLSAHEFIRRYLSHVLPDGFMRVRTFGFLANACKAKNIECILEILNQPKNKKERKKESTAELMIRVAGIDINLCQRCREGRLEIIALIPKEKSPPNYLDTS